MSNIEELVKKGKCEEALAIDPIHLSPKERFFRISALLSLGKGEEAMNELLTYRKELFDADPLMTLKVNFETRFILRQFDEARDDLEVFVNYPYVSQQVEEVLHALPKSIAASQAEARSRKGMDLEEALETLASPSDEFALLGALNALTKVGELSDYRDLVADLLCSSHHDDVKTYALMLLSSKGDNKEVILTKRGKTFRLIPSKLGYPYATSVYADIKARIEEENDQSVKEIALQLLDLYSLILYPEMFAPKGEEKEYADAFLSLATKYLGKEEDAEESEVETLIAETIKLYPPLLS